LRGEEQPRAQNPGPNSERLKPMETAEDFTTNKAQKKGRNSKRFITREGFPEYESHGEELRGRGTEKKGD